MSNGPEGVEDSEKLRRELNGVFGSVRPRDSREAAEEAIIRAVLEASKRDIQVRQQIMGLLEPRISDLISRVSKLEKVPRGLSYGSKPVQMPNKELGENILKGLMDIAKGIDLEAEVFSSLASLGLKSKDEVNKYFHELKEVVVERFEGYVSERIKIEEERIRKLKTTRNTLVAIFGVPLIIGASIYGTMVVNYFKAQRLQAEGISGQVTALEARTKEIAVLKEAYLDLNIRFNTLASNQSVQAQAVSNLNEKTDAQAQAAQNYIGQVVCESESGIYNQLSDLETRVSDRIASGSTNLASEVNKTIGAIASRVDKHADLLQKDGASIALLSQEISVLKRLLEDNASEDKQTYASVAGFIRIVEDKLEAYGASGKINEKQLDLLKKEVEDLRKVNDDYLLRIPSLRFGSD